MKNRKRLVVKPVGVRTDPVKDKIPATVSRSLFLAQWDQQLSKNRYRVIGSLILLWIVIRIFLFGSVLGSPLYQLYRWQESDSYFFDEQARTLAAGDWLSRAPLHPYHGWHQEMADAYFQQHPDKLNQILAAQPGRTTSFVPGKVLWNEWYGGSTYHQEPLYAYLLAFLYAVTGNGAYWMLVWQALIGVASGVLLWLLARRYFDDTVALLTGIFYALCGSVLFQEVLLLRTTWSIFFALSTVWIFQRALDRRTNAAFFASGLTIGLAFLLQSYFVLFLLGALGIYFVQDRKTPQIFLRHGGLILGGFMLAFAPVILRNAVVGAPLFSTSSTGAITFVATNVAQTQAINRWQPEVAKSAEIMGKTEGRLASAMEQALQSHPSLGSYLQLEWNKFKSLLNGQEWPNNENYAFYQAVVPVLRWTFFDFYWIGWLGVAGLLFALYDRKRMPPLYLAVGLQVAILLAFYVLGRLRAPLAVLLLPFAAYGLVACVRAAWAGWQEALTRVGVAAFCFVFLSYVFYRQRVNMLEMTDYNVLYELTYFERIKSNAEAKRMNEAITIHNEFLAYEPDFIVHMKAGQRLKTPAEIGLADYFANHHQIHSYLYEDAGNKGMAAKEMAKYEMLKKVADNSRQNPVR